MSALSDIHYYCPSCLSWFSKTSRPNLTLVECERSSSGVGEVSHCHCTNPPTEVLDAHEDSTVTPYDEMRLELLREELNEIDRRRESIINRIVGITGERP